MDSKQRYFVKYFENMTMFKLTLNQILIKIPTKFSFNQNNKERACMLPERVWEVTRWVLVKVQSCRCTPLTENSQAYLST